MKVNISIDEETGYYVAEIPELHIHTQWKTWDELLKNINEAVLCALEGTSFKFWPLNFSLVVNSDANKISANS